MGELTPEQFRRVESLFHHAKKMPSRERIAFVAAACADDSIVRDEVKRLLAQDNAASGLDELRQQAEEVRRDAVEHPIAPNADKDEDKSSINLDGDGTAAPKWKSSSNKAPGDSSPSAKPSQAFPKIDGYQITGVLGQGGMGIVYRAVQTKLRRVVALKILPAIVGNASPKAIERFRREAMAAARLHHTNIVAIHDFGESRDAYFYAMELVEGQPLDKMIEVFVKNNIAGASPVRLTNVLSSTSLGLPNAEEPPPDSSSSGSITPSSSGKGRIYFQQVARWMAEAADALHYAHNQEVVHRDIKPANLILANDGRIMITDFGLAKTGDEPSVTLTGTLLGTIRYMSPEQAMTRHMPMDHRTDIWSLGATMYELLTLTPAFPGHDQKQVLAAIITKDPIAPRKIIHAIPIELETICLKALEKAGDQRYASGREFSEDLRNYLNDLPIVAKRPGVVARAVKLAKRRKGQLIAGFAGIAVTVLLVIAFSRYQAESKLVLGKKALQRAHDCFKNHQFNESSEQFQVAIDLLGSIAASDPVYIQLIREQLEISELKLEIRGQQDLNAKEVSEDLGRALLAQSKGDLDVAEKRFRKVLNAQPLNVAALGSLAIVLKDKYNTVAPEKGLLDEAVSLVNRAIDVDGSQARLWNVKGTVLKKLDRLSEAEVAYREGIRLAPDDPYIWDNLGVLHSLRRDLPESKQALKNAVRLAGQLPNGEVFCDPVRDLAIVQFVMRDGDAVQTIEDAVKCDPNDLMVQTIASRMHLSLELLVDNARPGAGFADRLANGLHALPKRFLALSDLRLKQYDNAIDQASKAIELGDKFPTMDQLIIALANARLGKMDEAKKSRKAAMDSWPKELQNADDYIADAPKGILWFETGRELIELRDELDAILASPSNVPASNHGGS